MRTLFHVVVCLTAAMLAGAGPLRAAEPAPESPQAKAKAMEAAALAAFPPPGRLVDVGGGRRLQLFCEGPAKGGPTVIFETGAMGSSLYYRAAQDGTAQVARTCTYDRAGLGWSDPAPYPRSLQDRVDDLHALIVRAKLKGPYVLVGHSMGGLLVRLYAKAYPKDLVGLVLVESSEERFNGSADNVTRVAASARMMGLAVTAASNGVDIPQLHAPHAPATEPVALRASVFRAGQDDLVAMSTLPDEIARLGGLGSLDDMPLVVVSRGQRDSQGDETDHVLWMEAQDRLATLSTRVVRLSADKSGHNVPAMQPEIFAEAVRQVIALGKAR